MDSVDHEEESDSFDENLRNMMIDQEEEIKRNDVIIIEHDEAPIRPPLPRQFHHLLAQNPQEIENELRV